MWKTLVYVQNGPQSTGHIPGDSDAFCHLCANWLTFCICYNICVQNCRQNWLSCSQKLFSFQEFCLWTPWKLHPHTPSFPNQPFLHLPLSRSILSLSLLPYASDSSAKNCIQQLLHNIVEHVFMAVTCSNCQACVWAWRKRLLSRKRLKLPVMPFSMSTTRCISHLLLPMMYVSVSVWSAVSLA